MHLVLSYKLILDSLTGMFLVKREKVTSWIMAIVTSSSVLSDDLHIRHTEVSVRKKMGSTIMVNMRKGLHK